MRLNTGLVLLPLVLLLGGCFEDPTSSSNPPSNTTSVSSDSALKALAAWAPSANLNLAGDTDLADSSVRSRWDSVVNLSKYGSGVRTDLQQILSDWDDRHPVASGWTVVSSVPQAGNGTTYLVKFSVDGVSQGGLVWVPTSTKPLPVVLFGHPSDQGVDASFLAVLKGLLGTLAPEVVIVVPAFRGENASMGSDTVTSDSSAQSPWDRDVDDGLAFLQATLEQFPHSTDASRIASVGYSRGAGVALISAYRDSRIHSVFEIAGPTDFFAPSLQHVALGLMAGDTFSLPGLDYLDNSFLKPFQRGTISADSLRRVLMRRSPARLALSGLLPATEAVHGTVDSTVSPDQSEALVSADPRVTYLPVQGMSHTSFFTNFSQTATIANAMQAFLKAKLAL